MTIPGLLRLAGLVVMIGVIAGCRGPGSNPPSPQNPPTGITAEPRATGHLELVDCTLTAETPNNPTVGPDGATIEVEGERLFIPKGALRANAQVQVSKISRRIGGVDASGIRVVVPEALDLPVMVTLSYAGCTIPDGKRPVIVQRLAGGELVAPNSFQYVNTGLQTVTVALEHLSDYMMASAT